ncbi:MAG: hypothetical protein EBR82_32585 [Caulobacteraceae bacterium]|nr:hypothetical protein [Caulobacteraceae bacterium]
MGLIFEILKKNNFDTDKNTNHSYALIYDDLFENLFDKEIKLLEIGIDKGGSIQLWQEVFPKGKFTFIDITDKNIPEQIRKKIDEKQNCIFIIENAYIENTSNKIVDTFDIIIDDGPHTLNSFIALLNLYLPKVKINGYLIIEDLIDLSWMDELKKHIPSNFSIDIYNGLNTIDDRLLILKNKNLDKTK